MKRVLGAVSGFFGSGSASVKEAGKISQRHREYNRFDWEAIRRVGCANPLPAKELRESNPGIRVERDIVRDEAEENALATELHELKIKYGFLSSLPQTVLAQDSTGDRAGLIGNRREIKPFRVTGRPEFPEQKHAPWSYGDEFNMYAIPPHLRRLAMRVAQHPGYPSLGPLRDITIDYREGSMFKLDPSLAPETDGRDVFVIGLSSPVVMTFTPFDRNTHQKSPAEISRSSWTGDDLDVYLKRRWMVNFTDKARNEWKHAIRSGVQLGPPEDSICDWWGTMDVLLRRDDERLSISLAFE